MNKTLTPLACAFATVALSTLLTPTPAAADAVGDFYKGKTVNLIIGYAPGAGYDTYGRLIARHFGRFLPGTPNIVPQNMPGAGSIKAANHIYNVAAKDGSVLGMFASSAAFEQMFGGEGVQFDTAKFTWIGNIDESIGTCGVWHTTGVENFDQMLKTDLVFGGSGAAAVTSQHAIALRNLLGAKIKLVQGYNGAQDVKLAMARGEVQAGCGMALSSLKSQHAQEWKSGQLRPIIQLAIERSPDLPNVAHIYDYAKDEEMRQVFDLVFGRHVIGRPLSAPPGVPTDRKQALRKAFMDTMQDKTFLADADKLRLDITPSDGEGVEKLFARFFSYPKTVVAKAVAAMKE
ncbi:MAG: Bug family tripartite tricarboxylate transporter substrate binding protein [Alphaproteobacteria bacterium]